MIKQTVPIRQEGQTVERKKLREWLIPGCILLGVWFLLQRFDALVGFAGTIWMILSPFVLGAVIAFVLNVPMRAIEGIFKKIKKFHICSFCGLADDF